MNQVTKINKINSYIDDINEVNKYNKNIKIPKKLSVDKTYNQKSLLKYESKINRIHSKMMTRIQSQMDTYNLLAKQYNSMRLGSDANYNNGHTVRFYEIRHLNTFYEKKYLDRDIAKITVAVKNRQHLDYVVL